MPAPLTPSARGPGRPREFDLEEVLERAMRVFQQHGYHATSISDLAQGMGLSGGSLYKAFKDKRGIFLAAFDHYTRQRSEQMRAQLARPGSGRELVLQAVRHYAEQCSQDQGKDGCLVVTTAVELAAHDDEISAAVARVFAEREQILQDVIARGQADGSIADGLDGADTARFLWCLVQGMRVYGKTAPPADAMARLVAIAARTLD